MRRSIQHLLVAIAAASACSSERARTTPAGDSVAPVAPTQQTGASRAASSYVGLEYESLPRGVKSVGGAILPSTGSAPGNHAFEWVATPRGDMVWLDTIGAHTRTVRAELVVPALARDERLFISSCDVAGRLEPGVIAIVVNEPNATRLTKVRQAWRVSPREGRFEVIPVAGIVCDDPGS